MLTPDQLREEDDKIRRFLSIEDSRMFWQRVGERHQRALSRLRTATDLVVVGQHQGELNVLEWLYDMKKEK